MQGDLCRAQTSTNAAHCWHSDGWALVTSPPRYGEVCCHCGEHRYRVAVLSGFHGPYLPRLAGAERAGSENTTTTET